MQYIKYSCIRDLQIKVIAYKLYNPVVDVTELVNFMKQLMKERINEINKTIASAPYLTVGIA